jgi:chromosome segregation ATPase
VTYRADYVDREAWKLLRGLLADPNLLNEAFEQMESTSGLEHLRMQLEREDQEMEHLRGRLDRLLDLYLDGEHTLELMHSRQRKLEAQIAQVQGRRTEVAARLESHEEQSRRIASLQEYIGTIQVGLDRADKDLGRRKWIVDALNVTIRLGMRDEMRTAVLYLDDIPVGSFTIPKRVPWDITDFRG